MLNCKSCNRIIMDKTRDGGFKLRTRMVLFTPDKGAIALCPTCKTENVVPVALNGEHARTSEEK